MGGRSAPSEDHGERTIHPSWPPSRPHIPPGRGKDIRLADCANGKTGEKIECSNLIHLQSDLQNSEKKKKKKKNGHTSNANCKQRMLVVERRGRPRPAKGGCVAYVGGARARGRRNGFAPSHDYPHHDSPIFPPPSYQQRAQNLANLQEHLFRKQGARPELGGFQLPYHFFPGYRPRGRP